MKIPNWGLAWRLPAVSLARIVSEDSQPWTMCQNRHDKSSKDS